MVCTDAFHAVLYGMPFVAKLFSAKGDSYFKTNSVFYRIDSVFLHNQVSFFTEPTWFLFKTDSIGLQNQLDSLNRTDLVFLQNRLDYFTRTNLVFYRTDWVFSLNRLFTGFFTEPTRFYELVFFIINKVRAHSQL